MKYISLFENFSMELIQKQLSKWFKGGEITLSNIDCNKSNRHTFYELSQKEKDFIKIGDYFKEPVHSDDGYYHCTIYKCESIKLAPIMIALSFVAPDLLDEVLFEKIGSGFSISMENQSIQGVSNIKDFYLNDANEVMTFLFLVEVLYQSDEIKKYTNSKYLFLDQEYYTEFIGYNIPLLKRVKEELKYSYDLIYEFFKSNHKKYPIVIDILKQV